MRYLLLLSLVLFLFPNCGSDDDGPVIEPVLPFSFEGRWTGLWNDSLFSGLAVSAETQDLGDGRFTGQFYFNTMGNANFTPCCGGANNDGVFTFTLEGNQVMDFEYRQNAPDYMGGCPGFYTGSGELNESINQLRINFTGDDCDGFHDNGTIFFKTVE